MLATAVVVCVLALAMIPVVCAGVCASACVCVCTRLLCAQGQWSKNLRHGRGIVRFSNGKLRNGIWKAGTVVAWESEEYVPAEESRPSTASSFA